MTSYIVELLLVIRVLMSGVRFGAEALAMDYYMMRCPFAEMVVKNTVNQALRNDPTLAAGLLRMHFHDCFIQAYKHICLSFLLTFRDYTCLICFLMFLK